MPRNMLRTRTRSIFVGLVLVAIVSLGATALLARPGGFRGRSGEGGPLGRMLQRLDLTEEQLARIEGIVATRRDAMQEKRQLMHERRSALAEAIHAEIFDEAAIREAAAAVAELDADFAVDRARGLQEILGVLTDEQRALAREMMERHRARMAAGDWGFRGGPRFHGEPPPARPLRELDQ